MKKIILAGALAVIALVSLPSASFAYGDGSPVVVGTVGPEKTVSVDYPTGFFSNNELLTAEVTCTAGTATILNDVALGAFRAIPADPVFVSESDGAFSLLVTLPAGDFGTCSCNVTGLSSGATGSADITYVPGEAVAYTGFDAALYVWTAAGVIVLGAALMTVMITRRKAQAKASA